MSERCLIYAMTDYLTFLKYVMWDKYMNVKTLKEYALFIFIIFNVPIVEIINNS